MKRATTFFLLLFLCSASALLSQNNRLYLKVEPQGTANQPLLLEAGKSVQFSAKAFDVGAQGTMVEVPIDHLNWSVDPQSFGSIGQNGLFTAGTPTDPTFNPVGRIIAHATVGAVTIESIVSAAIGSGGGQGDYTFRGMVIDENRQPIPHAHVSLMNAGMLPVIFDGFTNSQGVYEVTVPAGTYVVLAEAAGFVPEYFDNSPTRDKAKVFTTDPAQKIIDRIDFVLSAGQNHQFDYAFEGTVKDGSGNPIEGARITANSAMGMQPYNFEAKTDAQGAYSVKTPAGSFLIHAEAAGFIPEFYDDTRDASLAVQFDTDPNSKTVTGIDFTLGAGGKITGTVTAAADGSPVPGILVQAIQKSTDPSVPPMNIGWAGKTDQNGYYEIEGLGTGDYLVFTEGPNLRQMFYDGQADAANADPVSVTEGGTTGGIDFALVERPDLTPKYLITGVVKDVNGSPLMDAFISAEATDPALPHLYGRVGRDGVYQIHVPAGTFRVRAEAPGLAGEYYDDVYDASQATMLTLDDAQPRVENIDFVLSVGGTITGTVVDAASQSPLKNVHVMVADGASGGVIQPNGGIGAITDENGEYTITGLGTGDYTVTAMRDGYVQMFYDNVADAASATKVSVVVNQETGGIDFAMAVMPGISGMVTDQAANLPIEYASVLAFGSGRQFFAATEADGSYHLALPPGDYTIQAQAPGYLSEWYDDVTDPSLATTVSVAAGGPDQTGIDFALGEGGVITGVVLKASDNSPIEGAAVSVLGKNGNPNIDPSGQLRGVMTDATGTYRITGLETGNYKVVADKDGYEPQYYDMVNDPANATDVSVTVDQTTSGIDFAMNALPGIAGRVTDADNGNPLIQAEVMFEGPQGRPFFAYTDHNGEYHMGLPSGTYKVSARSMLYSPEWYNEKSDPTLADDVVVTQGAQVGGIDFTLETAGAGSIAGTVTDGNGDPIAKATVFVLHAAANDPAGMLFNGKAITGQDGSYEIKGLPAGSYNVSVHAMGFLQEFYDDASELQFATAVQVVKNQQTAGIDFELSEGGSISGTVTDEASGNPIPHAFVHVRYSSNHREFGARADASGSYTVKGLPTGSYIVFAIAPDHAGEFYDDATDPSNATPVSVTAPAVTTGIDFALGAAHQGPHAFRGTVSLSTGIGGQPMLTLVEAVNPQTGDIVRTTTDLQGAFQINAWDDAIIRARALGFVGAYAGNTYDWKQSRWNGFTGGMNISLEAAAESGPFTLFGVATNHSTGKPVADAWIYGLDASGATHFAVTDASGAFAIENTGGNLDLMVSAVGYDMYNSNAEGAKAGSLSLQLSPTGVTAVDHPALPVSVVLEQNYPNPFNPSTTITYSIPSSTHVRLAIYNLLGQDVATLTDCVQEAGTHTAAWNASTAPSGVYLYRLEASGTTQVRRMLLSK